VRPQWKPGFPLVGGGGRCGLIGGIVQVFAPTHTKMRYYDEVVCDDANRSGGFTRNIADKEWRCLRCCLLDAMDGWAPEGFGVDIEVYGVGNVMSGPPNRTSEYEERDAAALDRAGGHYSRHVNAMTEEGARERIAELQAEIVAVSAALLPVSDRTGEAHSLGEAVGNIVRQLSDPIEIVIHCPECGEQHIDEPVVSLGWTNPPHRTHLCEFCGITWRPCSRHTVGVASVPQGPKSTWPRKKP
jgi:hypothetical protein